MAKPPTRKHYTFYMTFGGDGETAEEAWQDCLDAVANDGLGDQPDLVAEPPTDGWGSVVTEEECQVCFEKLDPGTNFHCEEEA